MTKKDIVGLCELFRIRRAALGPHW